MKDKVLNIKKLAKSGGQILQAITPTIQRALDTMYPEWGHIFNAVISLYGVYLINKQDALNEIVEFIKDNPDKFREGIVQSKEFQKGFLIYFEQYLKIRVEKKKEYLNNILLGFTQEQNKEEYELEQLNDCLVKISLNTLVHLNFIRKVIIPMRQKAIDTELETKDWSSDKYHDKQWWLSLQLERETISKYVQQWLYENYNPNSDKVKAKYTNTGMNIEIQNKQWDLEKEKQRAITNATDELVNLGILKLRVSGGTWDNSAGASTN